MFGGLMNERMNENKDEGMKGWMDEWTNEFKKWLYALHMNV